MSQCLDKTWNLNRPHWYCDAGAIEGRAYGLIPPTQVRRQECLSYRIEGQLVLRPNETMAFVRVESIGYRNLLILHGLDDLIGLVLIYPGIISSLGDQYWPLDIIHV